MDEAGPLEKGNDGHDDAIGGEEDDADVEPGVEEDDDVEPGGEEGPAKESGEERHRRRGTSDRDCCRHWKRKKMEFLERKTFSGNAPEFQPLSLILRL